MAYVNAACYYFYYSAQFEITELHALTLAARSYALLLNMSIIIKLTAKLLLVVT